MRKDLHKILHAIEQKVASYSDESALKAVEGEATVASSHKTRLSALRKIAAHLKNVEKPSRETLNALSLFAGFQSWDDLKKAMMGEADAAVNYTDKPLQRKAPDADK